MVELLQLLVGGVNVGILCGIFFRLGELKMRVEILERHQPAVPA